MQSSKPLKLYRFEAKNIKRLSFVEIVPDEEGGLTIISGKNAQGKSSTLDSLAYLLGGAALIPDKPIKTGEKTAHVEADLGSVVIRRDFTLKGSRLTITKADGSEIKSVQTWLNDRIGDISFDPLEFTRMKPKDQREKMMGMVKLAVDIDALDAESKKAYGERTIINREVKRLDGAISELPSPEAGLPKEEVSVSDLSADLQAAHDLKNKADRAHAELSGVNEKINANEMKQSDLSRQWQEISEKQDAARKEAEELVKTRTAAEEAAQEASKAIPDIEAIEVKMSGVEATNTKVRQEKKRRELREEREEHKATVEGFTETIDNNAEIKEKALANAEFPTPGLGFDETGITYKGLPFDQASQAEQLNVSLSIAMLDNPEIRILLIKDGSLLDPDNVKIMHERLKEKGYFGIMERVEEEAGSIIISDGKVKK